MVQVEGSGALWHQTCRSGAALRICTGTEPLAVLTDAKFSVDPCEREFLLSQDFDFVHQELLVRCSIIPSGWCDNLFGTAVIS